MKIHFTKKPTEPDRDGNLKVPYLPSKRQQFKLRWYLILLLVASPFLYVFWWTLEGWIVVEAPGYVEIPTYQITAPSSTFIEKIFVTQNQLVHKSDALIQLSTPNAKERLEVIRADSLTSNLKGLYESELKLTKQSVKDYESLYKQGAATIGEVEVARLRLIQLLSLGQRRQGQIADAEISAQTLTLKAPNDSIIIKLEAQEGVNVQAGDPLMTIQETTKPKIVALLAPRFALYAHPGQAAIVEWDSGFKMNATVLYDGTISSQIPEKMQNFRDKGQGVVVQLELESAAPRELVINSLPVKVKFSRHLF